MPLATVETNKSVKAFVDSIENESKREDTKILIKMMQKATGKKPKIWGDNFIIGFGNYTYRRKGGKEDFNMFHMGFAPRKNKITLYLTCDLQKELPMLKKLGKCSWGKGCLYIKRLADLDMKVLEQLIDKYKTSSWH